MIATLAGEGGEGAPLVYLPGIDGTGLLLLGTARRLEGRFRLLRFGYAVDEGGESPGAGYGELGSSVATLLASRSATPAILLAESFGGAVALRVALDHPELVAGVVLVNSFVYFEKRIGLACTRLVAPVVPSPLFKLLRVLFGVPLLFGGRWETAAIREFLTAPLRGFDAPYRLRLRMVAGLDLRPELGRLEVPLFLFAGSWDLVVDSVHQAKVMTGLVPAARLEVIPRGGHLLLPLRQLDWGRRLSEVQRACGTA